MIPGIDRPLKIFISAGEVSGDVLGGRLLAGLANRCPAGLDIRGIGGTAMEQQGLKSLFPISELAIMGLVEVLPHIPRLTRRIRETAQAARSFGPDVLITIDAPGFNKRLAKACGETDFPKVHYVAPTVWAWRPKRVHSFKALFDALLCLLPFEPPYFSAVGLNAPFVGHSILESGADSGDGASYRRSHRIPKDAPVLCLLPGSRKGELNRLISVFRDTAELLGRDRANLHIVIPTVPHLHEDVSAITATWPMPVHLEPGPRKYDAMAASTVALAASGTVALELAMARVPTVIAYRLNPLTYSVLKRLVRSKFAHLLNILSDREIVPEAIQGQCRADSLAGILTTLMGSAGELQIRELEQTLRKLKPAEEGLLPSEAAANAVLETIRIQKTRPGH